jgi:hypothetical protein
MFTICVFCILVYFSNFALGGWIDPDTDNTFFQTKSLNDGRVHHLVFSDEFNIDNRKFDDGSDPKWTAINKDDYTNFALQYYSSKLGWFHIVCIV